MSLNFDTLVIQIESIHFESQKYASQQVNFSLTMRNILIGYYLVEYEQKGSDRANYGKETIKSLAKNLKHLKGISKTQLYRFREFYITYPEIFKAVTKKLESTQLELKEKFPTASGISFDEPNEHLYIAPEKLLNSLSFSHFIELINIKDSLKRRFYEVQCIKNNWAVRELGRAINTMLYERTGLSKNKKELLENFSKDQQQKAEDVLRNPYVLEFMGLEEKPSYTESDIETAIINHLQSFLTELGRGFCFEARQKRISFDNSHYRIDLVFYHRILKCHVLIDLKIGKFDHADAGQMNLYLNYYRKNEMTEGDFPPVGMILCASKNNALVEYTTTGLSNDIFVSKYLVELPSKEVLEAFIEKELKENNEIYDDKN